MAEIQEYKNYELVTPATGTGGQSYNRNITQVADDIEQIFADMDALESAVAVKADDSDLSALETTVTNHTTATTSAHGGIVPSARTVSTTAPLGGGGNLSGNLTLTISAASGSSAGSMSASDYTKLAGIASGATSNATDAQLRDRSTHTGEQAISTVTGLQTALDDKAPNAHDHEIVDIEGLQTELDGKLSLSGGTMTGDVDFNSTQNINNVNGLSVGGIAGIAEQPIYVTSDIVLGGGTIFLNDGSGIGGGTLDADSGNVENVANLYVDSIYGGSGSQNQLASYGGDAWNLDYVNSIYMTGGNLSVSGGSVYMGDGLGAGGGSIYLEGGALVFGNSTLDSGSIYLDSANISLSNGGGINMGSGFIDSADGLGLSNGVSIIQGSGTGILYDGGNYCLEWGSGTVNVYRDLVLLNNDSTNKLILNGILISAFNTTTTYANNAAAISGGLVVGDVYATATGEVRVVV